MSGRHAPSISKAQSTSQPDPYSAEHGSSLTHAWWLNGSKTSMGTVHRTYHHNGSSKSLSSLGSISPGPLRVRNENLPRKPSTQISHRSSWGNDIPVPSPARGTPTLSFNSGPLEDINLNAGCGEANQSSRASSRDNKLDRRRKVDRSLSLGVAHEKFVPQGNFQTPLFEDQDHKDPPFVSEDTTTRPFKRWMSTLRRKGSKHKRSLNVREERWSLDDSDELRRKAGTQPTSRNRKRLSLSSSGFVAAVKTMSMSIATSSTAPRSRKTRRSDLVRSSNISSRHSHSVNRARASADDSLTSARAIDEAVWNRAIQRRSILEELLSSEESYIADLKVLVNVYFTLLASAPSVSPQSSTQIQCNVSEILSLHEELLCQLRRVIPESELRSANYGAFYPRFGRSSKLEDAHPPAGIGSFHVVRRSFEVAMSGKPKRDIMGSEPRDVAEVAKVFDHFMGRFFVYEEYGAKYESMLQDMVSASRTIPNWHIYERGVEALANSLAPASTREENSRKGLTFGDLLIKPIQRVCKYPLLFADIYKQTPVFDCPESHAEVEKVLCRLRETTMEINKATNDRQTQAKIQRSWRLQDLLVFPDSSSAPLTLRLLGHSILCGVLYVVYQSKNGVCGEYMLCVLFKSCLLLATSKPGGLRYDIVATIGLGDMQIDNSDNGRGLQCHTALYSWKVFFESDLQLFEVIFCACSFKEEEQWKANILQFSEAERKRQMEDQSTSPALYSILSLDIRPLGSVFGHPGSLARRISMQRPATVSSRTNVYQVIIRNTYALKESGDPQMSNSASLSRSQSLLSTNRIPILAPKRADRIRMEHALSNVWTRDILPYPGMSTNRGEHLIRASASSMMRKLSRASIASSFTKRSTSYASLADSGADPTPLDAHLADDKEGRGIDAHPAESTRALLETADGLVLNLGQAMSLPNSALSNATRKFRSAKRIKQNERPEARIQRAVKDRSIESTDLSAGQSTKNRRGTGGLWNWLS